MYTLKIENARGQSFELTHNEKDYQIVSIDGLNPPNANIIRSTIAGVDGSDYKSTKLEERNIVLTIRINGEVEKNRLYLYSYFRTKAYCKLYFRNSLRDVYAEGYVETNECGLFNQGQLMQVSIICPNPYFNAAQEIVDEISQILGAFEFPFSAGDAGLVADTITDDAIEMSTDISNRIVNIQNYGDDESGVIIEIIAHGQADGIVIHETNKNQTFRVMSSLTKGSSIIINTNPRQKSVRHISANGVVTNYMRYVRPGSTWFKLDIGDNLFSYSAEVGAELLEVIFRHRTKYEAV